jgi:hypothetical protein
MSQACSEVSRDTRIDNRTVRDSGDKHDSASYPPRITSFTLPLSLTYYKILFRRLKHILIGPRSLISLFLLRLYRIHLPLSRASLVYLLR